MSGKIKIFGLVLAAALTFLFAGHSFGQDPCGGHYAGQGLKAMFLPLYDAATCNAGECNVLNDNEGVYYRYQVPGGDCVYLFKAGHVIVGIGNSGRHAIINFDKTQEGDCAFPYTTCNTQEFMLRTDVGFTPSRGHQSDPDVLVLTSTNVRLNFGAMTAGKTYYCQTSIKFRVAGDPVEYQHHFQAKVFYGYVGGVLRWVITPIDEPYYVYTVTKIGKKLVPVEPPTWHESSVYAEIGSDTCPDYYGTYCLPFKLILERLQ
ncbi:MAG: hypothetical protein A2V45_14640 [Candidatus Aminicenantes bacterium RBG_19FT_COMBO_58_17]|nr:MAG: hypothetical protein A2V45_14640 [Candidatus Aminicenantes bacterium RBG_19FT_COMBO_58_17]